MGVLSMFAELAVVALAVTLLVLLPPMTGIELVISLQHSAKGRRSAEVPNECESILNEDWS